MIVYFCMGRRLFLEIVQESVMVPSALNVTSPIFGSFGVPVVRHAEYIKD